MKATITPIAMGGKINSIPSKSYAHRMLLCAMLSGKEIQLNGVTGSKDIEATINCIKALYGDVEIKPNKYIVKPVKKERKDIVLDCIESGSTLRFILPIALALGKSCKEIEAEIHTKLEPPGATPKIKHLPSFEEDEDDDLMGDISDGSSRRNSDDSDDEDDSDDDMGADEDFDDEDDSF